MIRLLNILLFTFLLFLAIWIDVYLILGISVYILILFLLLSYTKNRQYLNIGFFVFFYVGCFSLTYAKIYISSYGNSLGPYYDDSLYYFNSIILSNFSFSLIPPTLFEFFLAIPQFVSQSIIGAGSISHLYLLPVNWLLASLSIVYVIKLVKRIFPNRKINYFLVTCIIVFNFNFIDTAAHLYRDMMLILFIVYFLYYLVSKKFKILIFIVIAVFFLRGANAILLVFLGVLYYLIVVKKFSLKKTSLILVPSLVAIMIFASSLSSSFFRGGFGSEDSGNLQERVSSRLEYNNEAQEGSASLRSGNKLMMIVYPLVYTFSPFLVKFENVNTSVRQADMDYILGSFKGDYVFPKIYKIPFYFHIISISFIAFFVIRGVIACVSSNNKIMIVFMFFMIFQILAISIISMQARHRLPIVYMFPIFYMMGKFKSTNVNSKYFVSILILLFLIILNLYINL